MQGLSGKDFSQVCAMESRQDALQKQMSIVLSTVHSHTETLSKLKSMFVKFMTVHKELDRGKPTKSHSLVYQQSRAKVLPVVSVVRSDLPVLKSGTRRKEKEISKDNNIHSADQDETPASVATCTKEGTANTNEISPVSEAGNLVDSFLDLDGIGGTEENAQLAAAKALAGISSPNYDSGAKNNIEDAKVGTEAKDTAAPIQPPQNKGRTLCKGSPSN